MKVLFITHGDDLIGGANRSMLNLIDALSDRVDFVVAFPRKEGKLMDALQSRNIPVYYLKMRQWMIKKRENWFKDIYWRLRYVGAGRFLNFICALRLTRIVRKEHIDIIHTNVSVLSIGADLHRLTGVPHIWHIREYGEEDHGIYYRGFCGDRYNIMDKGANVFIAISNSIAEKYKRKLRHKVPVVVYNGVPRENLILRNDIAIEGCVNFLISGSINQSKGQCLCIQAVHYLIEAGETDFHLYIAGKGPDEYIEKLLHLPEYEPDYVTFLGQVDNLPELCRQMHVALVCSRCEAFGRVTVESMMACMPVIGSNSGGTPELIVDGETGYLFERGNAKDLSEKMRYFIQNKVKIIEMGSKAQQYSLEHFTIERCANGVYDEYCKVLNL